MLRRVLAIASLCLLLPAAAPAGLWDDLKETVGSARDVVDDVKSTKDEAKGAAQDAKGMVDETAEDVGGALPEKEAAPPPPPSASPPPPPSARTWHLDAGNGSTRQVSQAELVQLIQRGEVGRDTPVYGEGVGDWTAAGQVPSLRGYFQ